MKKQFTLKTILVVAGAALLMGCAAPKPFEYHSDNEIPKGPGLFSGEKGEFKLYDDSRKVEAPARQMATPPAPGSAEEAEFREFQEWRKDQKAFEEFKQWKQSGGQNSADYEEFRDWQRWQEYKRWQESKPQDR
ncbi:MAG: hypothetical protein VR64_03170 [Desulfatitalea sp. BRH_c12]|nr:MAG: hypothetical protein VR64_03170 [Desulfatitalea sp. BRH_c12]